MCAKESRSFGLIYCAFLFVRPPNKYHWYVKVDRKVEYILQSLFVAKFDDWASFFVLCQSTRPITTELRNIFRFTWNLQNIKCCTCIVVDWLGHSVEEEASAKATREEHAEPEVQKLVKKYCKRRQKAHFHPYKSDNFCWQLFSELSWPKIALYASRLNFEFLENNCQCSVSNWGRVSATTMRPPLMALTRLSSGRQVGGLDLTKALHWTRSASVQCSHVCALDCITISH